VEVSRGCRRGCRFCAAGYACLPARFRKKALLEKSFLKALEGHRKIGLLGTAVSDHPDLLALCRFIRERGGEMAIGSLRLDKVEPELVRLLKEGGAETLSLAPEAGSQRLRDLIAKDITEAQIFHAVEVLGSEGIANIRLYFMIGLPTEEEEDIEAIIQLTKKIKNLAGGQKPGARSFKRITLSVNQFIPKAGTPFQRYPLVNIDQVKKRVRHIAAALRQEPAIRLIHDQSKWNYIQALLALGDRRVGKILLALHHAGGNWSQTLKAAQVDPDFYVYRAKDRDEMLPWDFIT
ncbi:MAG: radical SAM protein, partial [Syntrophales bacterium]|nr:radical SAM protein [Syntrophales bacterium]